MRKFFQFRILLVSTLALFLAIACAVLPPDLSGTAGRDDPQNLLRGVSPKYVFLFIGDGMGPEQIRITEAYLAAGLAAGWPELRARYGDRPSLAFTGFPAQGSISTYSASHDITDSAAAGTALATGQKTRNGVVGLTSAKWGRLPTLAEQAKKNGRRVGIVSSAPINHATPATFYAHISSRFKMYDIGRQLIESDFDYFGGGGFQKHDAKGRQSLYDLAEESGLVVLRERQDIQAARYEHGKTILAVNPVLNGREAMPDGLDLFRNGDENGLGLNEFVQKGIELLENENGFFMMVEGGKIDWAGHDNEAERLIFEILEFNLAVESALEFAAKHPEETLIVVTADHETGDLRKEDKGGKGGRAFDPGDWPGAADPVFKQAVADLAWHDREHSDVRVPVYALGRGSELFSGHYDNTDVAWKLFGSMQATPGQIVY